MPIKTPQQQGLGWGHPPPQWPHPSFPSHKLPTLGYTYVGGAPSKYIKFGNGKLGRPGQWTGMIIEWVYNILHMKQSWEQSSSDLYFAK